MKVISWNIDSLNAALTGESTRALLSQAVFDTIVEYQPEMIDSGKRQDHTPILLEIDL